MAQERLIDIAIREFGLHGLDGASTRSIAAAAGTAMSAITYHYGGKEGLYLAAADHIAERLASDMGDVLPTLDALPAEAGAARTAIHVIVSRFVDKMASSDTESWSLFIMREQMRPTEAFNRIYAGMMGQMLERLATLIGAATGVDEARARLVTITLIGQVIVLRSSRASCLRLLKRSEVDDGLIADMKRQIGRNLDAIFDTMTAEGPQPQ
ncbi:MAG: CerR family C-terminal domain-containing protein [Sphingomonas sp.]